MSYFPGDVDYCTHCENVIEGQLEWHGICPFCGWQVKDPPDETVILFTNAPKCFDYANTHEAEADLGYRLTSGMDTDKPVREIWIREEYYAGIQKARNSSGLYPSLTSDEFDEWKSDGFLVRKTEA